VFPYKRRKKTLEIGGERELLDFRTEPPKGEEKRRDGRRRLKRRSCKGARGIRPQGCESSDPHPWCLQSAVPSFLGEVLLNSSLQPQIFCQIY